MKIKDDEPKNARPSSLVIALVTAIVTALITGYISYSTARYQVEKQAAITLSFTKEQFDARLSEYPKLWRILASISTRSERLTPEKAHKIAEDLNIWFYDKGGLVADSVTRSIVYDLREACFNWKSGEQPPAIFNLKQALIYSCRNDLSLVSDEDAKPSDLHVNERNKKIQELQKKAGFINVP